MSDVAQLDARLYVEGELSSLAVRAVRGREGISELFKFEVELHDTDASFDFDTIMGQRVHLTISWGTVERHIDGIVSFFEQLESSDEGAFYCATVSPEVLLADMGTKYRVFSDVSVRDLISQVISEIGVEKVILALADDYIRHACIVQYGESDWALLSRWMEAEGIRYFFEHQADGHTLVISDASTTHDEIGGDPTLAYRKETLDVGENVIAFELTQRLVPARVTARDYPLDDPRQIPEERASATNPGNVAVVEFPAKSAQKRLDALRLGERKGRGKASTIRFAPGRSFTLEGHARASYNDRWLLTSVTHHGTFADGGQSAYRVGFEAVPGKTPYRPERRTQWPRIVGAQMAVVKGPAGSEIHTDASGRVQVSFSWDSANTDIWIPLSHAAASQSAGTVHLPRVGDAVLVEFLDGNPDRPVMTGRIYHKLNVHPYTLPANKTKTVFRDISTPGGKGHNELSFDSASGSEEVYLRAQRNSRTEVLNDASRHVGHDDTSTIDGARSLSVGHDNSTSVGRDDSAAIAGSQSIAIGANQSIAIQGDRELEVVGDERNGIDGDRTIAIGGDEALTVAGTATATIDGNRISSIAGYEVLAVSSSKIESIEGDQQTIVEGSTFESHGSLTVCVTGETSYSYGGDLTVESSTIQKLGAPKIYIAAGSNLYLRALESITLEVGSSKLTVYDGKVTVTNGGSEKTLSGDTIYLNC